MNKLFSLEDKHKCIISPEKTMPRQRFVMGNWKMNGTLASVNQLLEEIKSIQPVAHQEIVIFPSFVYIQQASQILASSAVKWGGQNIAQYDNGAYTGEISAKQLKELGCQYVLIGHSERRQYFHESNEVIIQKCLQAAKAGLRPVLCLGETLAEYQSHQTEQKVLAQLESVLKSAELLQYLPLLVIAYEPVWAIGTGLTATPPQAQAVHEFIRKTVSSIDKKLAVDMPILYGGSVKASNAAELFAMTDIDGALVGGASLISEEFRAICHTME